MNMNEWRLNIILSLLVILSLNVLAQDLWHKEIYLSAENASLRDVLTDIRDKSGLNIIYDDNLAGEHFVTYNNNDTAQNILNDILEKVNYGFKKYDENTVVVFNKRSMVNIEKTILKSENVHANILDDSSALIKPILLSGFELKYPESAVNKKLEGKVYAKFKVDIHGKVKDITIAKSSGYEILDLATINYLKGLLYIPAEYGGEKTEVWTTLQVKFNIE